MPRPFPCLAERFWYCRLALNHKTLHYGDLEENAQGGVTLESLQEKSMLGEGAVCAAGGRLGRPPAPGVCLPLGGAGVIAAPFPLVPVADIKAVVTGKECPHMKEKGALKQNKVWASQGGYYLPPPRASAQGRRGGKGEACPPAPPRPGHWLLSSSPRRPWNWLSPSFMTRMRP